MEAGEGAATSATAKANTVAARVGFAYQSRMLLHRGRPKHPEKPERVVTAMEALKHHALLERMEMLRERAATDDELAEVHARAHIESVISASRAVRDQPDSLALQEPQGNGAIYYHEETAQAARLAAGSVLEACDAVLRGDVRSAFALVRPPGHHAEANEALGFCFFNNAAVAAANARSRREQKACRSVSRVAILDWDVHHGNGTQHIFEREAEVLFISLHRYGRGFFPGTGGVDEAGGGPGAGRTVNVPWMQAGLHDADYDAAFALVVMPLLREFAPELLIVSAGFDAADGDIQGKMKLTPGGFATWTKQLLTLRNCAPVFVFEGGYHLQVSAECITAVVREMLADADAAEPTKDPRGVLDDAAAFAASSGHGQLAEHTEATLRRVIAVHQEHWACLRTDEYTLAVETVFGAGGARGSRQKRRREAA